MPQMSPMFWMVYPGLMMLLMVVMMVTLNEEKVEIGLGGVMGVKSSKSEW